MNNNTISEDCCVDIDPRLRLGNKKCNEVETRYKHEYCFYCYGEKQPDPLTLIDQTGVRVIQ